MNKDNNDIEPINRYCPICDKKIQAGSSLHRCNKKDLNKIEKYSNIFDGKECDEERTFEDKLQEFEDYNNINYYDRDK